MRLGNISVRTGVGVLRIVVLGAGVMGVTTAYEFHRRGHEVVVLEREPAAALQTSFANGGQISVSHAEPWSNPAVLTQVPKWLFKNDAPLLVRLRAYPDMWRWLLRFLRNCCSRRFHQYSAEILGLAIYSRQRLIQIREETGIQYDQQSRGILHIFRDRRAFDTAIDHAKQKQRQGWDHAVLNFRECLALEPALGTRAGGLTGGLYWPLTKAVTSISLRRVRRIILPRVA